MSANLTVLVRTGHGRMVVPVQEVEYGEVDITNTVIALPEVEAFWVDNDTAEDFIYDYANLRNLTVVYDKDEQILGLFNPRHDTFRRTTFTESGVNLLQFIEPEFIIFK